MLHCYPSRTAHHFINKLYYIHKQNMKYYKKFLIFFSKLSCVYKSHFLWIRYCDIQVYAFKAQWSLYVPPGLTFNNFTFCPHIVFMCFVWIWEQTAITSLYSINWLVCITEMKCVYCAVRTGSLYIILRSAHTGYLCVLCGSESKQWLFPYTVLTDWFV